MNVNSDSSDSSPPLTIVPPVIQNELETFPSASQPPWNLEFHHPLPRRVASRQGRLSMTAAGPASDHIGQTVTETQAVSACPTLRQSARRGRNSRCSAWPES